MTEIVFAEAAFDDLRAIQAYYQAPSAASDRFTGEIGNAIRHLSHYPGTALVRLELSKKQVRFWLVRPYWIVLQSAPEQLTVVAVLHCSRNVSRELRRRLGKKVL